MRYYTICIITAISVNAFSQTIQLKVQDKSIELKQSKTNLKTDNVIEVIKDTDQNDVSIYSNYLGIGEIKEGQYKGEMTGYFNEGVVFSDGSKYEFSEKETYLCNIGENIYTEKIDFLRLVKHINVYTIGNKNITKTSNSITIPFNSAIDKIEHNDYLLYSNFYESLGDTIIVYNKNLNQVKIYKPFDNGFSNIAYTSINNSIFIVTTPYNSTIINNSYKVTLINTQNNFSFQEINYKEEITPLKLVTLENKIVLVSFGKIILFDKNGKPLWAKKMNINSIDFPINGSETDNLLFTIYEGAIVCLNLVDGNELWRTDLKKIYPKYEKSKSIKNEYYMAYSPIDFKLFPSLQLIGLLSAKREQTNKDNKIKYSDVNLTLIDYRGKISKQITLNTSKSSTNDGYYVVSRNKPYLIQIGENGFRIVTNGEIENYEK
ncbi:MAG: hypothetical protein EHM93_16475 [Bacteroidales bacterium]|nr:MAG: hypothetical protein EHM93_16475 [Bacteroidales bacterium]